MDWLLNMIYFVDENGDPMILKSCLALFAFVFIMYIMLDVFYIVRSASVSLK